MDRMVAEDARKTHHLRHRPACRICGRELPQSRSLVFIDAHRFCKQHWRQYKIRQREGVTSEDLNSDWSDTFGNWRERPAELNEEIRARRPYATPLYFWRRYEHWLLFMRHYYMSPSQMLRSRGLLGLLPRKPRSFATLRAKKASFVSKLLHGDEQRMSYRAGDCLAVNLQTREIHRFVDVYGDTVLDDLESIRSAPYQTEIAGFWGKPEPTGIAERFTQQYMDEQYRFRIPDLVRLPSFPVYGVFDNVFDFSLCSLGVCGDVWEGISNISFVFSSTRYPQVRENFAVSSSDVRERNIHYDPELAVTNLFGSYRLNEEEREQAGNPSTWEGGMIIDDVTFTGEILHWPHPYQLSHFRLKSEKALLSGHAFGPSLDELFHLLKGLRVINEQEDLLAQYQRELDEESQRLFNQTR